LRGESIIGRVLSASLVFWSTLKLGPAGYRFTTALTQNVKLRNHFIS